MELLFVHINKPYGALEEKSFNISSKYIIEYIPQNFELNIKVNNNFLLNFFGENIQDVTCIIGENGVGKTTFIRYIKELFFERRNEIDNREGDIVVYKSENKVFVYTSTTKEQFRINNNISDGIELEIVRYKGKPKLFDRLKEELTIYYSNNFDLYDDFIESEILYNTSTPFLSRTYNARINKEFSTKKVNLEQRFLLNEFQRNRKFLQSEKSFSIKSLLKSVNYIEIIPVSKKDTDYKRLVKSIDSLYTKMDESGKRDIIDLINQVANAFYKRKKSIVEYPKRQLFDIELTEIIVFEVLVKLLKSEIMIIVDGVLQKTVTNVIHGNDIKGSLNEFLKKIPNQFFELTSKWKNKQNELKRYFHNLNELVDLLINKDVLWDPYPDRATIRTNSELLDSIIKSYFELPFSTNSLKLDWSRLSAGEESMITFFSRIDGALRLKSKKRDNILILIDEGDLYFHPEWQRQYLRAIFDFLKQYKDYKFQIILTSHSPFILSDLPQNNVITFQKTEEGIDVSKNKLSKTFGGNIHELLIDKFFLKDGIVGAFADNKIMELIKRVNDNEITEQDEILVNEIGDKFLAAAIRTNLEESYDKN